MNVGYGRVSSGKQALIGKSLEKQKKEITDYFVKTLRLKSDEWVYVEDDGYSAKSLKRPGWNRVKEMIKNREVADVVVCSTDRLTRNILDLYQLFQEFTEYDTGLTILSLNVNFKDAMGKAILGQITILGQLEREMDKQRVEENFAYRIFERHEWLFGKEPYGFRKDGKGNQLFIYEPEANVIRLILELAHSGHNMRMITNYLNENGIGEKRWSKNAVGRTMHQTTLYGVYYFKEILVSNFCQPIVSKKEIEEFFRLVGKRKRKSYYDYLFKEKVYCVRCHYLTTPKPTLKASSKLYVYYYCEHCNGKVKK